MYKKTIGDILPQVRGKSVLVRVDFNVPIENGRVIEDTRISASLPTIRKLQESGARVTLMSHLGRPKNGPAPEFSLAPVARHLATLSKQDVTFATDCIGPAAAAVAGALRPGQVCLLENLRFHAEEEKNDPEFARQLAVWGDIYVNDAFGSAHRAHASTEGVTHFIDTCVAGYLMERELDYLGRLLVDPKRPFVAILGGAKISGKLEVIENLLKFVDVFLIGGGMAFTFLRAQGHQIGRSLVENDLIETAGRILRDAGAKGTAFLLPVDCVAAPDLSGTGAPTTVGAARIPTDLAGFDIGPRTIQSFASRLKTAGTIFWNGPMGVFEKPPFDAGTVALAQTVAEATDHGSVSVVGGGDSVAAVHQAGVAERISHISTGGGASLEFLEGRILPGVAALDDRE
ncbi:MAG: phosphoglycerate kinase [candidate division Zixibacteria bacterium]|nr:phosphoglycerate kinase [candidate division Zixibacteria bacterium]